AECRGAIGIGGQGIGGTAKGTRTIGSNGDGFTNRCSESGGGSGGGAGGVQGARAVASRAQGGQRESGGGSNRSRSGKCRADDGDGRRREVEECRGRDPADTQVREPAFPLTAGLAMLSFYHRAWFHPQGVTHGSKTYPPRAAALRYG